MDSRKLIGCVLLLISVGVAEAAPPALPGATASAADSGWWAYRVAAAPGGDHGCCYQGLRGGTLRAGCQLRSDGVTPLDQNDDRNPGIAIDQLPASDQLIVLMRLQQGELAQVFSVAEACPIDARDITVHWLDDIDTAASQQWLVQQSRHHADERVARHALLTLSRQGGAEISQQLARLARELPSLRAVAAILGLGQRDDEHAGEALHSLLTDLPASDARRAINHALAEKNTPGHWDTLRRLAWDDHDPEQRDQAVYLLGEHPQPANRALLQRILAQTQDERHQQAAIIALGQQNDPQAATILLTWLEEHPHRPNNGLAWYACAQADPVRAPQRLLQALRKPADEEAISNMIGALADLDSADSRRALLSLTRPDYPRQVRTHAIRQIADGDHPQLTQALWQALEQS
ncbi:MAG: hypothetical protein Tsb002_18960 [Wenzhouxiangellaceae bacterium]